jgi:hypothetical protein
MMRGVSWRGGSQEIARFMTTAQLKMEDIGIHGNVIKKFWWKKSNQDKNMRALWTFQAPNGIGTIVQKHITLFV